MLLKMRQKKRPVYYKQGVDRIGLTLATSGRVL